MKVDLPALNWFIHVLTDNVGKVEWVPKTPEELAEAKSHGIEYPLRVVTHPIPEGKDILFEDRKKYKIECSEEYVRDLIVELAIRYQVLEREQGHLLSEKRSEVWHPASEVPDGPHSSRIGRRLMVFSPILAHVMPNGISLGHHNGKQWHIDVNGKSIPHEVTHWRHLPPGASIAPPYAEIKEQVEALKKAIS